MQKAVGNIVKKCLENDPKNDRFQSFEEIDERLTNLYITAKNSSQVYGENMEVSKTSKSLTHSCNLV